MIAVCSLGPSDVSAVMEEVTFRWRCRNNRFCLCSPSPSPRLSPTDNATRSPTIYHCLLFIFTFHRKDLDKAHIFLIRLGIRLFADTTRPLFFSDRLSIGRHQAITGRVRFGYVFCVCRDAQCSRDSIVIKSCPKTRLRNTRTK